MLSTRRISILKFLHGVHNNGQNELSIGKNHQYYKITVININDDEYLVKTQVGFYSKSEFIKKYNFNRTFYQYFNIFFYEKTICC